MSLQVGAAYASLGAKLDDDGFDRFDRRLREARSDADRGAHAKLDARADVSGFDRYDRKVKEVNRSHDELVRGTGRVRGAFGSLFIGGAGIAAGAVALGFLARGIGSVNEAFQESDIIARRTKNVIETTGGAARVTAKDVGDLATALSKKSGVDDEVIQSGENVLLTFTNVRNELGKGNDVFDQATGLALDMSRALGTDMQGAVIQLGKALNDPIKGITALSRVGVSFSVQQKEQIADLVKHNDRLGAQKIILAELRREFGGTAEETATATDKLKVTVGNLEESIGGALNPTLSKAADGLGDFIDGMQDGSGAGGKFRDTLGRVADRGKDAFAWVKQAGRDVGDFFGSVVTSSSSSGRALKGALDAIGPTWDTIRDGATRAFRGVSDALDGITPDLKVIANFLITVLGGAFNVLLGIVRRVVPGLVMQLRGFAQVVRGIVEILAGLITLDLGKVWDGLKRALGGLVTFARGWVTTFTAPFREVASRLGKLVGPAVDDVVGFFRGLPRRIASSLRAVVANVTGFGRDLAGEAADAGRGFVSSILRAVAGLPGAMLDVGQRAVSSIARGLSGLPKALIGSLAGAGQFFSNIGRGIADWLNDHTPLGDKVKVGPLSFRLPALARGGKVGPTAGGARAFIAGEGAKDEWVISQEGDRRQNIRWAVDALRTLTGRDVSLFAGGGIFSRIKRGVTANAKGKLTPVMNTGRLKLQVGRTEAGLANYDRDLELLNREYGQLDRKNSLSVENYVVERDDGTVVINQAAINKRIKEIDAQVNFLTERIRKKLQDYRAKVQAAIKVYTEAMKRLGRAISRAKGSRRKAERQGYRELHDSYQERRAGLNDKYGDLGLDLRDNDLDVAALKAEAADVRGTTAPAGAPPEAPTLENSLTSAESATLAGLRKNEALAATTPGTADDEAARGALEGFWRGVLGRLQAAGAPDDVITSVAQELAGVLPDIAAAAAATLDSSLTGDETAALSGLEKNAALAGTTVDTADDESARGALEGFWRSVLGRLQGAGAPNDVITAAAGEVSRYLPDAPSSSGPSTGAGSSSSSSSGSTAPATAEDIAGAVVAALQSFGAGRTDLFTQFGANFVRAGDLSRLVGGGASETELAAGTRYFGAGSGGVAGGVLAAGGQIIQHIRFFGPQPADPHTFAQASLYELQAAV